MLTMLDDRRPPPNPAVESTDYHAPGLPGEPDVRVRVYRPRAQAGPLPCLLWIHGGGHVLGAVEQDDTTAEHFVEQIGCVVASVDWRRSPEHPFPAAMNDCYAALAWTHQQAGELNIDPELVAIGGASSGGGSAAGLALMARDRGEYPICFQSLNYPMLDDRNVTPSSHAIVHPRVWNRDTNARAWKAYVGDAAGGDGVSPYRGPQPGHRSRRAPARLHRGWRSGSVPGRRHRLRAATAASERTDGAARLCRRHPRFQRTGPGHRPGDPVRPRPR